MTSPTSPKADDLPPLLKRYLEYKNLYPDAALFVQVGDFYEVFFDDAVKVSRALNLTLTSRDKTAEQPIPMCGVPLAVIDSYVDRLVNLGISAVIVSQTSQVGTKGQFERAVDRVVTPANRLFSSIDSGGSGGTISVVAFSPEGRIAAAVAVDPRVGEVVVRDGLESHELSRALGLLDPKEIIFPRQIAGEKLDKRNMIVRACCRLVAEEALHFRSSEPPELERPQEIEGYLAASPLARRAVRMLAAYLDEVSVGRPLVLRRVVDGDRAGTLSIDAATRRNLELVENAKDGTARGTLLEYLDETVTPGGARLLRSWILNPLNDLDAIAARLEVVRFLVDRQPLRSALRDRLGRIADLDRVAARLEVGVASPRDLGALRDALTMLPVLVGLFADEPDTPASLRARLAAAPDLEALRIRLEAALVEAPPHVVNEGGIIRDGFSPDLDQVRKLRTAENEWMASFEASERAKLGINSLKVKSNGVLGYFIEIPATQSAKAPAEYIRRQSTANAERFTTTALREREQAVSGAIGEQLRLEKELFLVLRGESQAAAKEIRQVAELLSVIDVFRGLAATAVNNGLIEPVVTNDHELVIHKGAHPIIAKKLGGEFVPNDLHLGGGSCCCAILTGPNMGGKSTYLRQAGLIVIMAQLGSFVPAVSAKIGMVDRVFARIGASDDLHEGDSTFMVEMREAAQILSTATTRSLVLIDELGRGTATADGLALANAILEWLGTEIGARTLFATHFYELTKIAGDDSRFANLSVGSVEEGDRVVFTHQIQSGPARRSYGIEVAELSGLPVPVIERARGLLANPAPSTAGELPKKQISLFSAANASAAWNVMPPVAPDPVVERLRALSPDEMTPREAISVLYELCEAARANPKKRAVS